MFVRIEFYVDCSPSQGTGHVMRSSVLGLELMRKGHSVCFFGTFSQPEWIWKYLDSNTICIHEQMFGHEHRDKPDLVFVDTYSQETFNKVLVSNPGQTIVSIEDDFTPKLPSAIRILQSMEVPQRLRGETSVNSGIMCGFEYMLIRSSLTELHFENAGNCQFINVLVMSGGTNSTGFTEAFSKIAVQLKGIYRFHIIGEASSNSSSDDDLLRFYPYGTRPEEIPTPFAAAVSLAGISSIEILSAGIPLVVSAGTDNQLPLFQYLTLNAFAVPLSPKRGNYEWKFSVAELQTALSEALSRDFMPNPFDFLGVERILRNLEDWLNLKF